MEQNQNLNQSSDSRKAVVATLAAFGFVALVGVGMWLAIYSARFVPGTVSRIGAAAVALTSVFTPAPSGLAVVPASTASTTIAFGGGTSTPTTTAVTTSKTTSTQPGQETTGSYQISGGTSPASYSGLSQLSVSITSVGYLTTNSTSSFVPSATVPAGDLPAVQFTIKNIGTNVAGPWSFSASIPTQTAFVFDSTPQQSLNPGDSIDYTLGFDDASIGTNETITITANYNNAIAESSTADNIATAVVNVQ